MGSSSSSMSNSRSRSTGAAYTKKLYFDPEADSSEGRDYWITDAELRETLSELVDVTERIVEVRYYKHPLGAWQLTDHLLHHAFIVFETNAWWWSIEKNDEGVTIQRSKDFDSVCYRYRRSKRKTSIGKGVEMVKKASGSTTVMELINHIWRKNYLNQEYDALSYNCQHFADLIYEFI
ncbi:uncharacterized protein LOC130699681 [Daphnia carinata]|uniref:uncharacterized protein LOC130699681 n=1 Tax=Daphnia carinata TaxID=120202 RepID=UPI0025803852|nr:uncharacterized protein LOC130699681 [Daphnia carinata]